jgi:hypothetical protein
MEPSHGVPAVRHVAMLGNHSPRQCGIATFTAHLSDALGGEALDCFVVAMNDLRRTSMAIAAPPTS